MTLADDAPHRRLLYVESTRDTSRSVNNGGPAYNGWAAFDQWAVRKDPEWELQLRKFKNRNPGQARSCTATPTSPLTHLPADLLTH